MAGDRPAPPLAPHDVLTVALTGNIASGKSEVARALAARGARLIDADALAREVVEPGSPALAEIAARWGTAVLDRDGGLDRGAMRRIVFADPSERAALEAIVHPRIEARRRMLLEAARADGVAIAICDIPLLFETRMERGFDVVLLVDAPAETRMQRLLQYRALTPEEATRMIGAQMPSSEKRARADIVIDNDGTRDALARRVDEVWDELARRARDANGGIP